MIILRIESSMYYPENNSVFKLIHFKTKQYAIDNLAFIVTFLLQFVF